MGGAEEDQSYCFAGGRLQRYVHTDTNTLSQLLNSTVLVLVVDVSVQTLCVGSRLPFALSVCPSVSSFVSLLIHHSLCSCPVCTVLLLCDWV